MNEQKFANATTKTKKYVNGLNIMKQSVIVTISGTTQELNEFKTYLIATIVSISGYCLCQGTLSCQNLCLKHALKLRKRAVDTIYAIIEHHSNKIHKKTEN